MNSSIPNVRARTGTFTLVLAAGVLIALEGLSFATYLAIRAKYFVVRPNLKTFISQVRAQYEASNFDGNTGWLPLRESVSADGSRISPDNPTAGLPCLSMYGDSFVFGSEVNDEHSWGNQIAKRLRCRVSNYGVPAYGTDQAYLRFRHNDSDQSPRVILNVSAENLIRNVNQNRSFLLTVASVGPFKPVFYFDDRDQLRLEPVPRLDAGSYDAFVTNPGLILRHDYFVPGLNAYGKLQIGFPYSVDMLGALADKRLKDSLLSTFLVRSPWWHEFSDPSHHSRAFAITEAIVDQFVELATKRGKKPIISFLPWPRDFPTRIENGKWIYSDLYARCQSKGYDCFDTGTAMVAKLGASELQSVQGICRYFCTDPKYLSGHYNERGNALLAEVTIEHLATQSPLGESSR
jgi:hypothetical protein